MEFKERIQFLVRKLENKAASAEELDELLAILQTDQYETLLDELRVSANDLVSESLLSGSSEDIWLDKIESILKTDRIDVEIKKKPIYRMDFFKYAAAACLLFILTSIFIARLNHKTVVKQTASTPRNRSVTEDIHPGSNRANLQLADGTVIALDSFSKGNIAKQGSTLIVKQDDGKIVYQSEKSATDKNMFNRMSTPNGGQYQLVLPDGTRVWMNAASFIKYPVRFEGKERRVEVQGELYFEVTKNTEQPFIVEAGNGTEIKVLGTHFNVNTYRDEKYVRATLLEGSIHITSRGSGKMLKPGEQAQVDVAGKLQIKQNVDLNAVMAWKNGLFNFNKLNTHEVMNQLARWYDIEIKYDGLISDQIYGGEIERDLNLSQVLKMLQKSGMHCHLDQKVLTVVP